MLQAASIRLGTTGDGVAAMTVDLDVQKLVDTRLLIQANSGGGKSWCLRRILEQTHGRLQHLVIDPEGEFASLREKYDYVLAARTGGDTMADPRSARLLAERLLELKVSAILDIYELKAHERVRFVRYFLEALVDAPKKLWHPALVVVDEAHVYAPQAGEAESAQAVIDLATRGRKRGFCAAFATQRLSKLHKDAAAECNNKIIGRTGLDVDVKRASDELGFGKERWRDLRDLAAGHFFAYGPAISREVVPVQIGQVETTHPKAGNRLAFTAPPPTERVRALLPKLSDLPAEAEQRQKTVEDLRKDVLSLQAQLRARPKEQVPVVERVEVPAVSEEMAKRLEAVAAAMDTVNRRARSWLDELAGEAKQLRAALATAQDHQRGAAGRILAADGRARAAAPRSVGPAPARTIPRESSAGLSGPEQRILDALAWLESIGQRDSDQAAVAFLAGYTVGGGAFNNPRGALNTKGLVAYRNGRLALTDAGRSTARFPDQALTPDELQRRVLERLPGPEAKILTVLLKAYPGSVGNDDLARASGYEPGGGAFNNPRGRLRTLGLIDYPERGQVKAQPVLFLEGAA